MAHIIQLPQKVLNDRQRRYLFNLQNDVVSSFWRRAQRRDAEAFRFL